MLKNVWHHVVSTGTQQTDISQQEYPYMQPAHKLYELLAIKYDPSIIGRARIVVDRFTITLLLLLQTAYAFHIGARAATIADRYNKRSQLTG